MKVLYVNTVDKNGSTGKIIRQLGDAVEREGGEFRVAFGRGKEIDEHSHRIGNDFDLYCHAALSRITDRAGFYSKTATKRFVQYIKNYEPNIIHLHNLHGYYLHLPTLFGYLKEEYKGKVIWTLHDCWAFTGHCVHYTWAKCEKWKTGCDNCPERKSYPASLLIDQSKRNYLDKKKVLCGVPNMTIVTVSDWLKEQVEQSILKDYPIIKNYNGIDTLKFRHTESDVLEKYGIKDKRVILLVSDGWNGRKGFNKLIELAEEAPSDWVFIAVGMTKSQIKVMPDNIIGIERTWNQDELIELYSAADVFFNPSVEDTFGLVTAEALACGTPAVVMNSTACPEIITNPESGIIVEVNAPVISLIDAINKSMAMKRARESAMIFDLENNVKEYINQYI